LSSHEDAESFSSFFQIIAQAGCNPTYVLADGAQAITNAVNKVFPEAIRLMCWAHVIKNIDKHLIGYEPAVRRAVRQEIESLQYAISEEQFVAGKFFKQRLFSYLF
jgi:transposase-like protein